uniref:Uncharacterized protein n=1 Tax=Peronospora matthiolae TaxID=2874970 RepID=A0AAV1V6X5_9STRA
MDKAESSTRNGKRADDRKCLGDHDPYRNNVTGGDPAFSGAAGGDLNRNSVTGGDPAFFGVAGGDSNRNSVTGGDPAFFGVAGGDPTCTDRSRWEKAMILFTTLKDKIAKTPIFEHFDPDRPPVIVVYTSKWAVSAALLQDTMEHTGL